MNKFSYLFRDIHICKMSVPLARRLAGPSFSHNVRYDQAWMTKRKEQARQDFKLGETKVGFVSEREVFDVKEGEIFGFIGPNGAGKSTTIRTLLSLIYPTSGEATIFFIKAGRVL